jgi:uncharacterized protein
MKNPIFDIYSISTIKNALSNIPQITFEVTDACNLKCKYCGYGEFYEDYDSRKSKMLNVNKAIHLLDYLNKLWNSDGNLSANRNVYISFYGGEPLMNMPFIHQIVNYVNGMHSPHRTFTFSMTTNAMLLDRHMNYLVDNVFNLLISLDGNEHNHSYRINVNGNSSFDRVVGNIDKLKKKYPTYFKNNVNFNAVLHNRNSVDDIYTYIKEKYNKTPSIGELNSMGIKPEMKEHFAKTYRNSYESLHNSENYETIERDMFLKTSSSQGFSTFIRQYSGMVFNSYRDLLFDRSNTPRLPTGTCVPFGKKMYVTVNGKILPCERIGHQFALGEIDDDRVKLDLEKIAQQYNSYFNKVKKQCGNCHNVNACIQCIFNLEDLEGKPICHGYMSAEQFEQYCQQNMEYMHQFPDDYYRVLRDVEIE